MAGRKIKQTVDYFPHYCTHKKTMYIIERQFGNDGYALWFKTLELLGKTEGHYYDCKDENNWEFYLSYCGINDISAGEILNKLSQLGAIDKELWEEKIIWSDKFIENIADAYRKRKTEPPPKPIVTGINDNSSAGNSINAVQNTQSKVEYSKVNKSRVNNGGEEELGFEYSGNYYVVEFNKHFQNKKDIWLAWKKWVDRCFNKHSPLDSESAKLQLKFLSEVDDPVDTINHSIEKNYKGLYERSGNNKQKKEEEKIEVYNA